MTSPCPEEYQLSSGKTHLFVYSESCKDQEFRNIHPLCKFSPVVAFRKSNTKAVSTPPPPSKTCVCSTV